MKSVLITYPEDGFWQIALLFLSKKKLPWKQSILNHISKWLIALKWADVEVPLNRGKEAKAFLDCKPNVFIELAKYH